MQLSRRAFLAALSAVPIGCGGSQDDARPGNATPTGIGFGRGRFVAVGHFFRAGLLDGGDVGAVRSGGAAWVSDDGKSFQSVSMPIGASAIAFGQERFVAVEEGVRLGPDGSPELLAGVALSEDGLAWRQQTPPLPLSSIVFGGDRFVAAGSASTAATSPDGIAWQTSSLPLVRTIGVAFGHGIFVAYGDGDSLALSEDGVTWRLQRLQSNPSPSMVAGLGFVNGRFVGSTVHRGAEEETDPPIGRLESTDGITWTVTIAPGQSAFSQVAEHAGRLIAVRGDGLATSDDGGAQWTRRLGLPNLRAIAAGPSGIVAVGPASLAGTLATSTDGERWAQLTALLPSAG
jgi:hypothetical protein